MSKIRWVHISDLHLDATGNAEWNLLQKRFPFPPIDFLVFTGDLHQFGQDYEKNLSFLNRLKKDYRLSANDIFIVPGNHDVDHDFGKTGDWVSLAKKKLKVISNTPADVMYSKDGSLTQRFSHYSNAVQSLCGRGKKHSYPWAGVFCREWKEKINIIHLNTALLSCRETGLPQMVDTTALTDLKLKNPNLPAIVLAHHNFYRLSDAQYQVLISAFQWFNVRAYLHGDIHKGREASIVLRDGRQIPCIAAPSIFRNPTDEYAETGAYLYEWDTDSPEGRVTITPYQWRRLELQPEESILGSFNMREIRTGLWETYRQQSEVLDLGMLPGIVYTPSDEEDNPEEYQNDGQGNHQPMVQLLEKHGNDKYFQLVGRGKQACGGTGKTSTLLSLAATLTNPDYQPQHFVPLYFSLKELYGLKKQNTTNDNRIIEAAKKTYQIEWDRTHPPLLFLLDGFNEIYHPDEQAKCIQDILDIVQEYYPDDGIIITSRDPLRSYIDLGAYDRSFDCDQLDRCTVYFRNCYVKALSTKQKNKYIGEPRPAPDDQIWNILDTPFYLSKYYGRQLNLSQTASRWLTSSFDAYLKNNQPGKVTLMLQLVLRDIDRLSKGRPADEAERQRFFLMKVLPFLGYRQVLADRLDSDLSNGPKLNFKRADIYRCTYICLQAYLANLEPWQEYSGDYAERLEEDWESFCELYENGKKPTIGVLTKVVPYSTFLFGLLLHSSGVSHFCHDNYRDFFAAFHIANVVYLLSNGYEMTALPPEVREVFLLQIEVFDHSILLDSKMILEQYFGLHLEDVSHYKDRLVNAKDEVSRLVLLHILIRFIEADVQSISRKHGEVNGHPLVIYRNTLYEDFQELFNTLQGTNDWLANTYAQFYIYVLALLARDYRLGRACKRDLVKCAGYAHLAAEAEKRFQTPKADGYLQMGLCINSYMEDLLNCETNNFALRMPYDLALAERIHNAVKVYNQTRNERPVRELMSTKLGNRCKATPDTLGCADIFGMMLQIAYQKYCDAMDIHYKKIAEFGFISKAYIILAALGTSGGAFNILTQMLLNQANQAECDPRLKFFRKTASVSSSGMKDPQPYTLDGENNSVLSFRLLQVVCNIKRGNQPYSHCKAAELILKGRVKISDDLNGTLRVSDNPSGVYVPQNNNWVESALNKAISGDNPMAYYWKGRYYLYCADNYRGNALQKDYEKMAIDCFQATRATGFPYESYLSGKCDAPPPSKWLSAVELLAFPEASGFVSSQNQVYDAIYKVLEKQVETVKQKKVLLENERYKLTNLDVRENIMRFRNAVSKNFDSSHVYKIEDLLHQLTES